jgi:hypothetical protein
VLGHKDLQMVKRYAHLSKAHIAGVLGRMNQTMLSGGDGTAAHPSATTTDNSAP